MEMSGEEDEGNEASEEVKKTSRKMNDPNMPSMEEYEHHQLTHMPYRTWCPICSKGRGKKMQHRRQGEGQR